VGIGFAIPIDTAKRVLNDLIEKGYYAHPWLGATLMTLFPDVAEALKLPVESGAMIVEVVPGSPANRSGLRGGNRRAQIGNNIVVVGGDVITRVEDEPVSDADEVIRNIRKHRPGDKIRLDMVRWNGTKETKTITLGEKPRTTGLRATE
jgi:putative serine protease PepD